MSRIRHRSSLGFNYRQENNVADQKTFDVVVIGSGPGGYIAAIRSAQLGLSTAIVEKNETLGGTCLNIGCIPSKALLDSSEKFHLIGNHAAEHGITVSSVSLDLPAMMKRKDLVVKKLTGGVAMLMKKNKVEVFTGTGSLNASQSDGAPLSVRVQGTSETLLAARNVILATGSEPVELPFLKFDNDKIISSTEALELRDVPKRLLVVGGGAIGLEMASVWARLGSSVTVVELQDQILPGWDTALARALQKELEKLGVKVLVKTKVTAAETKKKTVTLKGEAADGSDVSLEGDMLLVSVGRRPYTEGAGLEQAGVTLEKGKVVVDRHFRSSVEGVYAIGDIIQGPMLAHKAEDEGVAVAEIIAGKAGHVNYDVIPNVVYTSPEVASVGPTEAQLKEQGIPYRKGQFSFAANGRALATGDTSGFVKVLAHEETDRLLACHIVGPSAGDLISEAVVTMEFCGSSEDLARTVHAHPTLPEAVREAALSAAGMPLNSV